MAASPELIAPKRMRSNKGFKVSALILDKKSVEKRMIPDKIATPTSVQALNKTGLIPLKCLPTIFTLKPYMSEAKIIKSA